MENTVYSNLGNRINKTFRDKRDSDLFTIKDYLENKWSIADSRELRIVLIKELKELLKTENLFQLIQNFFELESNVSLAIEKLMSEDEIVNFEEFYKNLSPVLMRSLLEVSATSNQSEIVLSSIKESIRIAIEEEIYHLGNYE